MNIRGFCQESLIVLSLHIHNGTSVKVQRKGIDTRILSTERYVYRDGSKLGVKVFSLSLIPAAVLLLLLIKRSS